MVQRHHMEFPLTCLLTRAAVHENIVGRSDKQVPWNHRQPETRGEIVARPFEKFHNYGAVVGEYAGAGGPQAAGAFDEPVVWEKMDGFMCTMYRWENKDYIASKGSFHSIHAKWATAQIRAKFGDQTPALDGKTSYSKGYIRFADCNRLQGAAKTWCLAVIDNETGDELPPAS